MQGSDTSQPESSARSRAWSNPYKFRLWLGPLDHELLNDRQKRELIYFTGWGPKGCDDWNYKIALEFHCSIRTIQRDLRHLEKHALVDIRGALGKHRRIIAIPYPNRASWMATSLQQTAQELGKKLSDLSRNRGDKNVTHERRTSKTSINQQRNRLLYGEPIRVSDMESGKTPDSIFPSSAGGLLGSGGGGSSETSASWQQRKEARAWEYARQKLIDQLVRKGHRRESAITLANIAIKISIRQRRTNVTKAKQKTPTSPEPKTSPPS